MPSHALSRRTLLAVGAAGLGGLAVGCGGGSDGQAGSKAKGSGLNLLPVTPAVPNGRPGRLVFVLQDDNREPVTPRTATFRFGPSPDRMTSPVAEAHVRSDAAPAQTYLLLSVQLAPTGTVFAEVTADGRTATAPIKVVDALPGVGEGQPLPSVVTPSPGDLAGLEVACTRQPACPLHDLSLDRALLLKKPLAVLVSTPAFCQLAVCGPVLDVLLGVAPQFRDEVQLLHLEVFAERPKQSIEGTPLAPAVKAFKLDAEPTLFLTGSDGIIRQRIDGVFGTGEVTAALTALTA